ncbi:MAG: M20/M25/M40 family metallo-hydrolase [Candidatus Solibacter usitatus]|nr:M20/M25/M40 family metallo-hydrolase [Candidatus Solibacter usitatus]
MQVFELTRALIGIESITGNELAVGKFLAARLQILCGRYGGKLETFEVEPNRNNVLATFGDPVVTFSTHMDTVPPFFDSREDDEFIWGRGACDTKGIIASMITAVEGLLAEGVRNVALLFVVGEERNSVGAYHAGKMNRGSRYLINGEPTENRLALGSKGAFRVEVETSGRMSHSAYPELGESAIEKLLDVLADLRGAKLPVDPILGEGTINIGVIAGGRAPNVVPDYAKAELLIRLIDDGKSTSRIIRDTVAGRAKVTEVLCIPAVHLGKIDGIETTIVKYTTDIPAFGGAWGEPLLLGPGTIHVAHTSEERVPKRELIAAVEIYKHMARQLLAQQI